MKVELFSVRGWPQDTDTDADQEQTDDIGRIPCDVPPNVGDCVEWETTVNGETAWWTAVVVRRFFHVETNAAGRGIGVTVRLLVEMVDNDGDPFSPIEGA